MLIFVSQPMAGREYAEIVAERTQIAAQYPNGIVLNTLFADSQFKNGLEALALSIFQMAGADLVVMADGWEYARGCLLEHEAAKAYGIPIDYFGVACMPGDTHFVNRRTGLCQCESF